MTPAVIAAALACGGLGAVIRYLATRLPASRAPRHDGRRRGLSPAWRILVINVVASFLAGLSLTLLPAAWEPVAIAGFCSALSTWSTFMTDATGLWRSGRRLAALALIAAHIGYGLLAAFAGVFAGRLLV